MKIDSLITQVLLLLSLHSQTWKHTDCNSLLDPLEQENQHYSPILDCILYLRGYKILHLSLRDPQVHIQSFMMKYLQNFHYDNHRKVKTRQVLDWRLKEIV